MNVVKYMMLHFGAFISTSLERWHNVVEAVAVVKKNQQLSFYRQLFGFPTLLQWNK